MKTHGIPNQIYVVIESHEGGRMWQLNKRVCTFSHITLQWWSCLMMGRQTITCDSDYVHLVLHNSITEVCRVGFELQLHVGTKWFGKAIFKYIHEILEFHLTFEASNMNRWKHYEKSIGDSRGSFHCFNNFLSSALGSKWWKTDSVRSLNCLNECRELWSSMPHHHNGCLWSVCASSEKTFIPIKPSTFSMSAWKSSKFSNQATFPSSSEAICDKSSQNSLSTWKVCPLDRHFGGWTTTNSMIDMQRFNTDCKD